MEKNCIKKIVMLNYDDAIGERGETINNNENY